MNYDEQLSFKAMGISLEEKIEKAWKRSFEKYWDKYHGTKTQQGKARWFDCERPSGEKIESAEDLWNWWLGEMKEPEVEDECQMGLF